MDISVDFGERGVQWSTLKTSDKKANESWLRQTMDKTKGEAKLRGKPAGRFLVIKNDVLLYVVAVPHPIDEEESSGKFLEKGKRGKGSGGGGKKEESRALRKQADFARSNHKANYSAPAAWASTHGIFSRNIFKFEPPQDGLPHPILGTEEALTTSATFSLNEDQSAPKFTSVKELVLYYRRNNVPGVDGEVPACRLTDERTDADALGAAAGRGWGKWKELKAAPVTLAAPLDAGKELTNAAEIQAVGGVVVVDARGGGDAKGGGGGAKGPTPDISLKVYRAQVAGAKAVLVISEDDYGGKTAFPGGERAADVTIPVLMIDRVKGNKLVKQVRNKEVPLINFQKAMWIKRKGGGWQPGEETTLKTVLRYTKEQARLKEDIAPSEKKHFDTVAEAQYQALEAALLENVRGGGAPWFLVLAEVAKREQLRWLNFTDAAPETCAVLMTTPSKIPALLQNDRQDDFALVDVGKERRFVYLMGSDGDATGDAIGTYTANTLNAEVVCTQETWVNLAAFGADVFGPWEEHELLDQRAEPLPHFKPVCLVDDKGVILRARRGM